MLNKIIPDLLFDLRSAGKAFEDMKQMGLSGASPLGEVKTKAPNSDYHNHRDAPPIAARQAEVARDNLKREAGVDELNGQSIQRGALHMSRTVWTPCEHRTANGPTFGCGSVKHLK